VDAVQEGFRQGGLTARQSHGRRVFERRCATCHGPQGRGDGQNAYNLQPPPPDFQESLAKLSVADRRAVIVGGTAALDRSPLCPPWGRSLLEEEVAALVAYMEVMAQPAADGEPADSPGRGGWRRGTRR
jgi:mono/diheme cytochrome c family protein